jgi:hypothetical protein
MSTIETDTYQSNKKTPITVKPHPSQTFARAKKPVTERRVTETFLLSPYCKQRIKALLSNVINNLIDIDQRIGGKCYGLSPGQLLEIALTRFSCNQHCRKILLNIETNNAQPKAVYGQRKDYISTSFRILPAYKNMLIDLTKGYKISMGDVVNMAIRLVIEEIDKGEIVIDIS